LFYHNKTFANKNYLNKTSIIGWTYTTNLERGWEGMGGGCAAERWTPHDSDERLAGALCLG